MRKLRPLKRFPTRLEQKVAHASPADDAVFCKVGIPYEALEFLIIDDKMRRALGMMISLEEPIKSLRVNYPEIAIELKRDAVDLGRWIDGRLQAGLRSVEEVKCAREIAAAKASSSLRVSAALVDQYSRAF